MARQNLGVKKVNKLIQQTGLDIKKALVRGGTNHRIDLCIKGGKVVHLYKNGELEDSELIWSI